MGLSSEPGCPESRLPPRVQPAPYTDRLGTLGPFGDGLLDQPRLLFQAKSFQPRQGPSDSRAFPFLGRPFPAERRPSSPPACALPAVRPKWKGVGWRQVPGSRHHGGPGTRVPSPASSSTQRIFPSSSERPFRGVSPPVPAGRHPLRPLLRLRLGPAASLPRRWPVPAGSCATALSSPLRWGAKDGPRRARGYSPQQVRLPG
ncbi:hypothetical protein NDU88_000749 [Pleurodeles waltl]|uniref:Basic proline-rich protein-like n=1 Tax=Pleurodeles waltl TaxID=8319 RepID=A0AAV7UQW3_PLEWA|nr:hypothetical protein NDU88_000749 [Pleurodeles waltl]